MSSEQPDYCRVRAGRVDRVVLDIAWQPGVPFASGLTAYYAKAEAHHRKLADAAHREWEEYSNLAKRYRLLAEKAAATEQVIL